MAVTDQDLRTLQEELKKLKQDVVVAQKELKEEREKQLTYPLDANSATVLKNMLGKQLPDAMWDLVSRKYMQYSSAFEHINTTGLDSGSPDAAGWFVADSTLLNASEWAVQLLTGPLAGDFNYLHKGLFSSGSEIYYFNRMRLRYIFAFNGAPLQPSTMYLTIGDQLTDAQYWGFKVVVTGAGANVYGVAKSSASPVGEQIVLLYTDVKGDTSAVRGEAILQPGLGINFYLTTGYNPADSSVSGKPFPLGQGILKNPIPQNTPLGTATDNLFNIYVQTDDAGEAALTVSFAEFTTELQTPP